MRHFPSWGNMGFWEHLSHRKMEEPGSAGRVKSSSPKYRRSALPPRWHASVSGPLRHAFGVLWEGAEARVPRPSSLLEEIGATALTGRRQVVTPRRSRPERLPVVRRLCLTGRSGSFTNGEVADYLLVFCVTNPTRPPRSRLGRFVIPRPTPGVSVEGDYTLLAMNGAIVSHLKLGTSGSQRIIWSKI